MVHFEEWTTSSRLFGASAPVSAPSQTIFCLIRDWEPFSNQLAHGFSSFLGLGALPQKAPPAPAASLHTKARAGPGLLPFLKLLEAVLALGQALLGRFLA